MSPRAHFIQILQMAADNVAFETPQTIHGFEIGAAPMAGIGARSDAWITVFNDRQNVVWIPHPVSRIIGPLGMIMKAHHDVVFLYKLFDGVDGLHRFSGDGAQSHGFSEFKKLPGFSLVFRNLDHSIIDGFYFILRQLVLDLLNRFGRRTVTPGHVGLFFAQLLTGIKLNKLASGFSGLLDRFKYGKMIESVGLATDEEAARFVLIRNFVFGLKRQNRREQACGEEEAE